MANQIHIVHANSGPAFWGPGDTYTFLVTGAESGGSYFTMEADIPPGGGPPPHIHHREEEQFYILQGQVTMQAGETTFTANPGDFVHVPRGTVHAFRNTGTERARMLLTYSPAGLENLFKRVFPPAADRRNAPPPMTAESFARLRPWKGNTAWKRCHSTGQQFPTKDKPAPHQTSCTPHHS